MKHAIKWLALACAIILSVACAVAPAPTDVSPDLGVVPGKGVVVVQVVTNANKLSLENAAWSRAYLVDTEKRNSEGGRIILPLDALGDGLAGTRVFVGQAAPGRYRFAGLYSTVSYTDGTRYMVRAAAPKTAGDFRVEAGRLTSLGTVVVQPIHGDPLQAKYTTEAMRFSFVLSRVEDSEALNEFVQLRFPALTNQVYAQPSLTWESDELAVIREKLHQASIRYAWPAWPTSLKNGASVFAGKLGALYRRAPSGEWTSARVGGNREMMSYAELGGAHFSGGERGRVCRAALFDGPWTCFTLPDANQVVTWIGSLDSDKLHVLGEEYGRLRVYEAPIENPASWRLVADMGVSELPTDYLLDQWLAYRVRSPASVIAKSGLISLMTTQGTFRVHTQTGQVDSELKNAFLRVVTQSNGWIVASPYSTFFGEKPPRISKDGGASWDSPERLRGYHGMPYVFSNGDAVGFDSPLSYRFIGWKKRAHVPVLFVSANEDTKKQIGSVPYGCEELLPEISKDELLFTRCQEGIILVSRNRGHTWQVDLNRAVRQEDVPEEFRTTVDDTPKSSG